MFTFMLDRIREKKFPISLKYINNSHDEREEEKEKL